MAKLNNQKKSDKLMLWQERLAKNCAAYESAYANMDRRERIYRGTHELSAMTRTDVKKSTPHVRNLTAEIIEAQVNSTIPSPKVTPKRKKDEHLAHVIEEMLRGELDRMPFETFNDMMERTVPIQGGGFFLVEWDSTERTHTTLGDVSVSVLHPKQVVPQDGVFTGIEDMDYIILKIPQTKEYIKKRYGKDVSYESEEEPDVKSSFSDGQDSSEDIVTQYIAYYRNDDGGIGLYSWVCDTELCDLDDYQTRRRERCSICHRERTQGSDGECAYCGSNKFETASKDYEEIWDPIMRSDGTVIPGAMSSDVQQGFDSYFNPLYESTLTPTKIPYYKPDIYPVIMHRNVSLYGQFLGDSDVDKIADQQNTVNRMEAKIIDKLVKAGSYLSLPDEASIKADGEDLKIIRPGSAAAASMINVYNVEANIEQDIAYMAQVYEEARQSIGITDSFQGRADRTATSGKAKEFAAAQSAGRLESKRVMKNAAYAALFEAIFKFKLAYADEPRPVVSKDIHGNTEYIEFNRYDFLEQDDAGEWYWNDAFLFSCDTTAPLASNREAMWQETRLNLESGAFGDPSNISTLILFWSKMEMLHYPGAAQTKKYLEQEAAMQEEKAAMSSQLSAQVQMQGAMPAIPEAGASPEADAVIRRAFNDAARDSRI